MLKDIVDVMEQTVELHFLHSALNLLLLIRKKIITSFVIQYQANDASS